MNRLLSWLWLTSRPVQPSRWVVLDVETTGLDPDRDELVCVAAMAMHSVDGHWTLSAGDSLELVFRSKEIRASHDNVLLHGVGWGDQSRGMAPSAALTALQEWVGTAPVLAFHAAFDRSFLKRAFKCAALAVPDWDWLDVADVLSAVHEHDHDLSLDEWLSVMGVACVRRHQAVADVWATAQLCLLAACRMEGRQATSWQYWKKIAQQGQWLRRGKKTL